MLKSNVELKNAESINPSNNVYFYCGNKEMLRLEANGDIYVKGNLVENDKDVVEGLRDFLRGHKYCI